MTLAFSTQIDGKPTQFVEKIWEGLLRSGLEFDLKDFSIYLFKVPGLGEYVIGDLPAKLHTIRRDEKDRWKEGRDIHMVIHNRTPNRFQFAPVVKCVSTQVFQIRWMEEEYAEVGLLYRQVQVTIGDYVNIASFFNGKLYRSFPKLNELAINDGFESVEAFFEYFSEDFTGKIIHWTNLKY